jgi:integrase
MRSSTVTRPSLCWWQVDLAAGRLDLRQHPGKTPAAKRVVRMCPRLVEVLAEHRAASTRTADKDLVFATIANPASKVRSSWAGRVIKAACRAAGLDCAGIGPHALRRSYISAEVYRDMLTVKRLQRQVGHKKAAMPLDVYAQIEDDGDVDEQAAAAHRLLGSGEGLPRQVGATARNRA